MESSSRTLELELGHRPDHYKSRDDSYTCFASSHALVNDFRAKDHVEVRNGEEYVVLQTGSGISLFLPLFNHDSKGLHSMHEFCTADCHINSPAELPPLELTLKQDSFYPHS